jgi:hypothetical protein
MGLDCWSPYSEEERTALYRQIWGDGWPACPRKPKLRRSQASDSPTPAEKIRHHAREADVTSLGGIISEDPESGEAGSDDPFDRAPVNAYAQPERLTRCGTVDWDAVFELAGVPEGHQNALKRLFEEDATSRKVGDAAYQFFKRCSNPKCKDGEEWRDRFRGAIEELQKSDPLFGEPRPVWDNPDERHRVKDYVGWPPVSQWSVSTISRFASTTSACSDTGYLKVGDEPGPLTARRKKLLVHKIFVGCNGFRTNFQGDHLDEQIRSSKEAMQGMIHECDPPPEPATTVLRLFAPETRRQSARHRYTWRYYWQRARREPENPGIGGPNHSVPKTWEEWRCQLHATYPEVSASYDTWKLPAVAFGGICRLP